MKGRTCVLVHPIPVFCINDHYKSHSSINDRVLHKNPCTNVVPALLMGNRVGGQDNFSGSMGLGWVYVFVTKIG